MATRLKCGLICSMHLILLLWMTGFLNADNSVRDLTLDPGHLNPFGFGRPRTPVDEFQRFPNPTHFFQNYVIPLKPLVMRGAAKYSKAYFKWTDDYLAKVNEPDDHTVSVETIKKESRQQKMLTMSFVDFVKSYNTTENYMVSAVPEFLRNEVLLPCPLQCRELVENNLVDNVMWFSSGGTKSVVHTDAVDNINCLYRGEKQFYFIDPTLYGDKVDIDRPEGAYSAMDVDRVDFLKYPGLADVEYLHVNLTAGDCLYIPYKWIHQVRSYHSNIAVNIWWKHYLTEALDYDECNDPCDPDLTLEVDFHGFGGVMIDPNEVRDHFKGFLRNEEEITFTKLLTEIIGSDYQMLIKSDQKLLTQLNQIYTLADQNKDGSITEADIVNTPDKTFSEISELLHAMEDTIGTIYNDQDINIDEEANSDDVGEDSDETDDDNLHVKDEL